MWQQLELQPGTRHWENPSGCNAKLFSWVEVSVGAGTDGAAQPANFSTEYSASAKTTGEGSTALGFYNIQRGDAPYFTYLADNYAMSDNFHQSVNGGTGANHIMLGHADAIWFSDGERPITAGHAAGEPELCHRSGRIWRRGRRDREPESRPRHQQLVYRGRLRRTA